MVLYWGKGEGKPSSTGSKGATPREEGFLTEQPLPWGGVEGDSSRLCRPEGFERGTNTYRVWEWISSGGPEIHPNAKGVCATGNPGCPRSPSMPKGRGRVVLSWRMGKTPESPP